MLTLLAVVPIISKSYNSLFFLLTVPIKILQQHTKPWRHQQLVKWEAR